MSQTKFTNPLNNNPGSTAGGPSPSGEAVKGGVATGNGGSPGQKHTGGDSIGRDGDLSKKSEKES